jgi:hypothetical protein
MPQAALNTYTPEQTTPSPGPKDPEIHQCQRFLDNLADSISEFVNADESTRERFVSLCSRFESQVTGLLAEATEQSKRNRRRGTETPKAKAGNAVSKDQRKNVVRGIPRGRATPPGAASSPRGDGFSQAAALSQGGIEDEGDLLAAHMTSRVQVAAGVTRPTRGHSH